MICWGYAQTSTTGWVDVIFPEAFDYIPAVVVGAVEKNGAMSDWYATVSYLSKTGFRMEGTVAGYQYGADWFAIGYKTAHSPVCYYYIKY